MAACLTERIQTYSAKKDGERYLSPNFQVKEFQSRDGADEIRIDLRLVHILQLLRDHFGKSVIITSGYRTAAHNRAVGGAAGSQHLLGKAADIWMPGVTIEALHRAAEELLGDSGGLGLYTGFIHVDTRTTRARWKG